MAYEKNGMLLPSEGFARVVNPGDKSEARNHVTGDSCRLSIGSTLENIQIKTTDIHLYEQLFESVLRATLVQRLNHPQTDHIRAYCFRHLLVVIRQDLRTPRPTGWV